MAYDTDFERELHRGMQAPPAGSLFETFAHRALRRVDDVIVGRECPWPPAPEHVQLLTVLRNHQGRQRAVPLLALAERIHKDMRTIKGYVAELRLHFGVLLCSTRLGEGYWIAASDQDVDDTLRPYREQALTEIRTLVAMQRGVRTIDQILTQFRLELTEAEDALAR